MKEMRAEAQSIRALLGGAKFCIDYYQREYRWGTKQIAELIDDLAVNFLESHDAENERSAVEHYDHYFLGSIIISDKDGPKAIIDGQQRLTSLTLLLIYIYRQLGEEEQQAQLADLIFSQKYGKRSFNLDVPEEPERAICMDALFTGMPFENDGHNESVINILGRYKDIEDHFPEKLREEALPYFADWLIENVDLIKITAYSDADAYTIFETTNDRGLSLTPTEMLKGYLLSNIDKSESRNEASNVWRKHIAALQDIGKEEDADAIKAWLRSQYAKNIREHKRDAKPLDFEQIGTGFHRWVRENGEYLGLSGSVDFTRFIKEDFAFYTRWYEYIRRAAETLTKGLEAIHFNAQNNFTLQYPVLLAPLRHDDSEGEIHRKLRIVSTYLDILIARRIWNSHAIDYSTMQYAMFLTMRDIRGKTSSELATLLLERLLAEGETFANNDRFRLHGMNGRQVHWLLARMTDHVETRAGHDSRYAEYSKRGKGGYEIEHIWANHPEWHDDEFSHPADFSEYRNHIGGLLLLPKIINASYSDNPYGNDEPNPKNLELKRDLYYSQNLLAQSLNEETYKNNPGFKRLVQESGLPFRSHNEFKKSDLDERQKLYIKLAEMIWNPKNLLKEINP